MKPARRIAAVPFALATASALVIGATTGVSEGATTTDQPASTPRGGTVLPTTVLPTTVLPTTVIPTTTSVIPTTVIPTTTSVIPTTVIPTTTSVIPTTVIPTTVIPTTTSVVPTTVIPTTTLPTTTVPTTTVPTTTSTTTTSTTSTTGTTGTGTTTTSTTGTAATGDKSSETPAATTGTPPTTPPPTVAQSITPPLPLLRSLSFRAPRSAAALIARGARAGFRCQTACTVGGTLYLGGSATPRAAQAKRVKIGSAKTTLRRAGRGSITVKVRKAARSKVRRARKAKVTLELKVTDAAGRSGPITRKTFTLK